MVDSSFISFDKRLWFNEFFLIQVYTSHGYISMVIDSCYNGERTKNHTAYEDVSIKTFFIWFMQKRI